MPTGRKAPSWNVKKWIEVDLEELDENFAGFTVEILDPLSLTSKELTKLFGDMNGEDEESTAKVLPKILRKHNFTDEEGAALPQFSEDANAVLEAIPLIAVRFLVERFTQLVGPERQLVPLRRSSA